MVVKLVRGSWSPCLAKLGNADPDLNRASRPRLEKARKASVYRDTIEARHQEGVSQTDRRSHELVTYEGLLPTKCPS